MSRDWKKLVPQLQIILQDAVDSGEECGCQLAVYDHGELCCSIAAGFADRARRYPAETDTLFPIFSTGKGFIATAIHKLAEQGVLEYDAPVCRWWPEFGCSGKEKITLRHLLAHQAGLFRLPPGCAPAVLGDWEEMCRRVAFLKPAWEPGTRCRYQALTFAWLLGETAHRASGIPFPEYLQRTVVEPLHLEKELFFGLPDVVEKEAELESGALPAAEGAWYQDFLGTPEIRHGFLPSANGYGTARALAKHYAALIGVTDGVRLLFPETLAQAVHYHRPPIDDDPAEWAKFGLGYALAGEALDGRIFGHSGAAGAEGFADRREQLALGFVKNRMLPSHPVHPVRDRISELLGLPFRRW